VWHATLALLDGRLDEAETLAGHALAAGGRAELITATQYYGVQLLAIRQEQGRMGELEQSAREFAKTYPTVPAWRAGLARLLLEVGETENARRELDILAVYQFEDIPRDGNWMVAMTLLGELCAGLGDSERAGRLYELLLPFRDVNVVIGLGALCQGSAARYLGLLAACTGSQEDARKHFEQALEANAALRAPVCLAHTQLDYADALGPGARAAELVDAAARTAKELRLTAVAERAAKLRTPSRVSPEA
jgi:tetratricopeptide (TPR) repeat protein